MSMALCLVHCDIYVRKLIFWRRKIERCYGVIARDATELLDLTQDCIRRDFPGYESFDIAEMEAPPEIVEGMFHA